MSLIIPPKYKLKLLPETTEMAIKMLKDAFQERLSKTLNLRRVTAPLFGDRPRSFTRSPSGSG